MLLAAVSLAGTCPAMADLASAGASGLPLLGRCASGSGQTGAKFGAASDDLCAHATPSSLAGLSP